MKRFMVVAVLLAGCVGDVGKGKVAAEVADVPAAEAAQGVASTAEATTLAVDRAQSKIEALGAKITAKHPIVFHEWTGQVAMTGEQLTGVEFEVQMASLESDDERLTGHLKSEDFFHVDEFPTATFKSASIEAKAGEGGTTHVVSGDLTIRGNTKRVSFPAKIEVAADKVSASTEFTIDRKDFGVVYPGRPDDLVQDNVVLTIGLVAPRG